MAKFRSWNEKLKSFVYFENGEYSYSIQDYESKSCLNFDKFNWQNAELIDCKEKQLLLCQLRRKRKAVEDINWHIDNIEDFKKGYALIKRNLKADKKVKECEINSLECVLVDVFHMTDKELEAVNDKV